MSVAAMEVAVVTGGHPFDEAGFADLLRVLRADGINAQVQDIDDFVHAPTAVRRAYRAVLFYFFPQADPDPSVAAAWEDLLSTGQGVVVLHHALLAYPGWAVWDAVVGAGGRGTFTYHPGRRIAVTIPEPAHAITCGVRGWEMTDETYCMAFSEAASASTPLLVTDHPESMRCIGWARRCRSSRVVCLQSGHDAGAWAMAGFQRVLARGIAWSAGG
jgi:type 1 glutamine amidotransferase